MKNSPERQDDVVPPETAPSKKPKKSALLTPKKVVKTFASLKLAVLIIIALGVIAAWGTIMEAKYDSAAAQKIVYQSIWMNLVLVTLALTLISVMIDRWPWKKRHMGFVLAHNGILVLMLGSLVTHFYGVDGSMAFGIGESNKFILSNEVDLTVYWSDDSLEWVKIYDQPAEYLTHSPKDHPFHIDLNRKEIEKLGDATKPAKFRDIKEADLLVNDFMPYALRDDKVVASDKKTDGTGLRFQLQNANVNVTDWLLQAGEGSDAVKDLGPAVVVLTHHGYDPKGRNAIVLHPNEGSENINYTIYSAKDPTHPKKGFAKAGDTIDTGWMGLVLRVLKLLPHAKEESKYIEAKRPTPLTSQALKVVYNGEEHWIGLNSMLKLFTDHSAFVVFFANRRLNLDFNLQLVNFRVGRYQGTMRAASYESVVRVPNLGDVKISMNEPLKYHGFTFYQSSFQEDESGHPTASILSVNRDPGRWIKYLGSFIIVLGTILLFKSRHLYAKKPERPS